MEFTFKNKAMQPMMGFAIQLNKNRFVDKYIVLFGNVFVRYMVS